MPKAKGKAKADASVEEGHSASSMPAQGGACVRTPGNDPPACAACRRARHATQARPRRPNRCAVSGPKDYGALDDQKSKEAYSRAVTQPSPPALAHQPSRFPRPPAFHAYRLRLVPTARLLPTHSCCRAARSSWTTRSMKSRSCAQRCARSFRGCWASAVSSCSSWWSV